MTQMTIGEERAKELNKSKFWLSMNSEEIALFQLFVAELCMPFGVFHEAVEKTLQRSVFTHEFASAENLQLELLGGKPKPTLEEILEPLKNKEVIVVRSS